MLKFLNYIFKQTKMFKILNTHSNTFHEDKEKQVNHS